jgi:hypothetical protein
VFAQPGVVINYADGHSNRASNALETADGGYLVLVNSSNQGDPTVFNQLRVVKYQNDGLIQSIQTFDLYQKCFFTKLIKDSEDNYRTIGLAMYENNDTTYFISHIINQENELLDELIIPIDTLDAYNIVCDIVDDYGFVVSLDLIKFETVIKEKHYLLKFDWENNIYQKSLISDRCVDMIFSMCSNPLSDKYYATAFGYSQNFGDSFTKLLVIDTSLTIDTIQNFFDFTYKGRSVHFVNDTLLRYVTRTHEISGDEQNALLEQTIDHQETNRLVYGSDGYNDEPAVYQTLRRNADGSYWAFYFKNYDGSTLFPYDHPSWIEWQKISDSLTLEEKYFYGGDAYYFLFDVSTANDSGMLVTATRYDWNVGYPYTDAIVLKINPDGLLCSAPGQPPTQPHHAIVYPNPGHGALKVEAGPQIFGATFELFDIGGQRVVQQTLQTSVTAINTTLLPSGAYPWRIIWKGEVVEEGKWVKD